MRLPAHLLDIGAELTATPAGVERAKRIYKIWYAGEVIGRGSTLAGAVGDADEELRWQAGRERDEASRDRANDRQCDAGDRGNP